MKRYNAYRGSNTSMGCLDHECDDGEWVKYEDYKTNLDVLLYSMQILETEDFHTGVDWIKKEDMIRILKEWLE